MCADISLNLDPALLGTPGYRDLLMVNGDFVLTSDADRRGTNPIQNSLIQRLRTLAGEYFLNTSIGLPYYGELFGQKQVSSSFEAALQNVILSTPGVISLLTWNVQTIAAKRLLMVSFRAQTTAGEIDWSGDISVTATGAKNV